jgi:DNA-binding response OmpR family regulator
MIKRILVVDDDEAIRKSFALTFEDIEYEIDIVDSGEKGIDKRKKHEYDLILLDLKMPGMNGVQTLRELRKKDKHVPVYIITAFHEEFFDQLKSATRDGIDFEVLRKPIESEQLVSIVKGVLEGPRLY